MNLYHGAWKGRGVSINLDAVLAILAETKTQPVQFLMGDGELLSVDDEYDAVLDVICGDEIILTLDDSPDTE